jgi:outer membrane immunogenic protein
MRNRVFIGANALVLGAMLAAGSAHAADLISTPIAVPPPPANSSWSGMYLGLQGGWATGTSNAEFANGASGALDLNASGAFVGLVGGVNWQFSNNLVVGLEGDISAARLIQDGTGSVTPNVSHIDLTVDQLASIRARLGWLSSPDTLWYVTGGAAWAHASRLQVHSTNGGSPGGLLASQLVSTWQPGWTVGVGVEQAIGSNWTARFELDYAKYASVNFPLSYTPGGQGTNADLAMTSVKFALVKHFGSGQVGTIAATDNPFKWSGFYAGLNAGYGWAQTSAAFTNGASGALSLPAQGALAGGQVGFNWQQGNIVFGIEGAIDASRLTQDGTGTTNPNISHIDVNVDQIASIRGRLGWLAQNDLMLYGTAGVAFAHMNRNQIYDPNNGGGPFDPLTTVPLANWHTGWTVGVGVEKAIGHNWSAGLEYDYAQFNTVHYQSNWTPGAQGTDVSLNLHTVKFTLNKHF